MWTTFDEIRNRAGIKPTPDGRHPTLRALRHTFAVNRILDWYQHGFDVKRWLPHLSVYMGHVEPRDTYCIYPRRRGFLDGPQIVLSITPERRPHHDRFQGDDALLSFLSTV